MFKPWLSKNIRDITRSTKKDYPPKRKKPWLAGNFAEVENYHEGTYRPFPYPVLPRQVKGDGCAGRSLTVLTQTEWGSGEGGIPRDGDVKEFQTRVSGAVGDVTYSMDPFFSEVNENGDIAVIDPATGLITLEEGVCQGSYPPWIIYSACDNCGCASGTIWLEDSSGDCLDCTDCDCESADDCVSDCCLTEDGTDYEIGRNDTKQYFCPGSGGVWSVTGTGASIDQNGLLTTDGTACGTITVHHSVCQDKQVRVIGFGQWSVISSDTGGVSGPTCAHIADACANAHTGSSSPQDCVIGVLRYTGTYRCKFINCPECSIFGPSVPSCWPDTCTSGNIQYVNQLSIYEWICP
jgi:hypothetical protein